MFVFQPATPEKKTSEEESTSDLSGSTYKVGDVIDARDLSMGAWFESKIMKVTKSKDSATTSNTDKTIKDSKPVLGELSSVKVSNSGQNSQDSTVKKEAKDENANDSAVDSMETDDDASVGSEASSQDKKTEGVSSYDKVFDYIQDDGYVYHVIYEG